MREKLGKKRKSRREKRTRHISASCRAPHGASAFLTSFADEARNVTGRTRGFPQTPTAMFKHSSAATLYEKRPFETVALSGWLWRERTRVSGEIGNERENRGEQKLWVAFSR